MLALLQLIFVLHNSYAADKEISPVSYIDLNFANMNLQNCNIHFIDLAPLIDYSTLDLVPKSIITNATYYLERSGQGQISKSRAIWCALTIVQLPATAVGTKLWTCFGDVIDT